MPLSVTPESLMSGFLAGLAPRIPQLQDPAIYGPMLDSAVASAIRSVEHELGTRFDVTRFVPYDGAGVPPALDQTSGPQEYCPYLQWPGSIPGDGFPRLRPPVRPLVAVHDLKLHMPGALITTWAVPTGWLRVDRRANEILIAPSGGNAVYALAHASGGLGWRSPQTVAMEYSAGLGDPGLALWPDVERLVSLRAVIRVLPTISAWFNPTSLTSISADGLSQSRSSGYVFKDLEERLSKEADEIKRDLLDLWDGPAFVML